MKFIDEATIHVSAGNGGNGCLSFRRERFVAKGGPDGGDGGNGGSVYLQADQAMTTLVDYRYKRRHKAGSGQQGSGQNCTGRKGEDLTLDVPVGTTVFDAETGELLGDLAHDQERLLVARGGWHGLGNTRYKSSTNRAPRQTSDGQEGQSRELQLELKVLADVGLLGLPNAGKSSLLRAVSAARPKVADYPFTTLIPRLGVVAVQKHRSFVMADIPGIIAGAAEGAGLGIRFLKHLARTQLLLHIVDVSPFDASDPIENARIACRELESFSPTLAQRERWLVLNKIDLLVPDQLQKVSADLVAALQWQERPLFHISALRSDGTKDLCEQIMVYLEQQRELLQADPDLLGEQNLQNEQVQSEGRQRIQQVAEQRRAKRKNAGDGNGDDDYDVEIHYSA